MSSLETAKFTVGGGRGGGEGGHQNLSGLIFMVAVPGSTNPDLCAGEEVWKVHQTTVLYGFGEKGGPKAKHITQISFKTQSGMARVSNNS